MSDTQIIENIDKIIRQVYTSNKAYTHKLTEATHAFFEEEIDAAGDAQAEIRRLTLQLRLDSEDVLKDFSNSIVVIVMLLVLTRSIVPNKISSACYTNWVKKIYTLKCYD